MQSVLPSNRPSGAGDLHSLVLIVKLHPRSEGMYTRTATLTATSSARCITSKTNDIWEINLQPMLWPCYVHYVGVLGYYSNTPTGNVCLWDSQALQSPEYKIIRDISFMVPQHADTIRTSSIRTIPITSGSQPGLGIPTTSRNRSRKGSFFAVDDSNAHRRFTSLLLTRPTL